LDWNRKPEQSDHPTRDASQHSPHKSCGGISLRNAQDQGRGYADRSKHLFPDLARSRFACDVHHKRELLLGEFALLKVVPPGTLERALEVRLARHGFNERSDDRVAPGRAVAARLGALEIDVSVTDNLFALRKRAVEQQWRSRRVNEGGELHEHVVGVLEISAHCHGALRK
jgi:hypothetical protein